MACKLQGNRLPSPLPPAGTLEAGAAERDTTAWPASHCGLPEVLRPWRATVDGRVAGP
jgi:hypothetical protein